MPYILRHLDTISNRYYWNVYFGDSYRAFRTYDDARRFFRSESIRPDYNQLCVTTSSGRIQISTRDPYDNMECCSECSLFTSNNLLVFESGPPQHYHRPINTMASLEDIVIGQTLLGRHLIQIQLCYEDYVALTSNTFYYRSSNG